MALALIGLTTTAIGVIGLVVIVLGWVVYGIFNVVGGRREVGSELELAANRREYYDDETLEGPRLERVQLYGVLLLALIVVALPLYWIFEPGRQAGAQEGWDNRFASWGSQLFAPTAEGGFNCAGCHGGMLAVGGEAPFTVTNPVTQEIEAVNWKAPALNTVYYKFDEDEVRFILNYGRPFSPMSPWGLVGGGPMNTQQIDNLLAYMKSIQIPRENCLEGEDPLICDSGNLPAEIQGEIQAAAERAVENGEAGSLGEALFNLELASGAYSCARCHTLGWSYGQPGVSGQGAFGWNLTGGAANSHFASEADLINFIRNGSEFGKLYGLNGQGSGRMPAFGSMLTDEQIEAVVEYVRSL
jgi:mono/diheme cytochrome c family protein